MIRHYLFFLLLVFSFNISNGQKLGDYYVSISIDSTSNGRLKFFSDSTVELSNIPRHMSLLLKMVYKYTSTDSTIEILAEFVNKQEGQLLNPYNQNLFLKTGISLIKVEGGFIDYNKSVIYIRQKDFGDNPDIIYIVDGKIFIQNMGITDGYGLVRKKPKKNKALQKKLKDINKDNCTIEIVKGLDAYKRFGIKRVYGIIVINTKQ